MAPHSTVACGISALSRCERHSRCPGRTRSWRDGLSRCEPSVSTTCFSSTRLIRVEPYQRMSCIPIIGVRIDHLVNARPASPLCVSFDLEGPTARLPRNLSSVDCITSIGVLHDGRHFCALQPSGTRSLAPLSRRAADVATWCQRPEYGMVAAWRLPARATGQDETREAHGPPQDGPPFLPRC
jgi:hypothetical protein